MVKPQLQAIMDPFRNFVSAWIDSLQLPSFGEILRTLDAQTIPDNLRELGITENDIDSFAEVLHDGIPLFWLPRARIARRLIAAENSAARRQIIGNERFALIEDCVEVLGGVKAWKQHGVRRPVVGRRILSVSGSRVGVGVGC